MVTADSQALPVWAARGGTVYEDVRVCRTRGEVGRVEQCSCSNCGYPRASEALDLVVMNKLPHQLTEWNLRPDGSSLWIGRVRCVFEEFEWRDRSYVGEDISE